jgi:hypothetical protein
VRCTTTSRSPPESHGDEIVRATAPPEVIDLDGFDVTRGADR